MNERAVCILIQNPDGKFLGVSRRDTDDQWGLPGGKLEKHENIGTIGLKLAARRELQEETGFHISDYSEHWLSKFVEIFVDRCRPGPDGKSFDVTCFWLNYYDVFKPEKFEGDAGVVKWVTREELENGPFAEYNKKNLESAFTPVKSQEELLLNIKKNLRYLGRMLDDLNDHWAYEDLLYRYYHHSFKAYYVQDYVERIVHEFKRIGGGVSLNSTFMDIIQKGTNINFDLSHNKDWHTFVRPQMEAMFHTKYFLEMMVKYGRSLKETSNMLSSGWASVLYLYGLR